MHNDKINPEKEFGKQFAALLPETQKNVKRLMAQQAAEYVPDEDKKPLDFTSALKVATDVFDQYRADHLKWWKRMDGTPILNDVAVRMAEAFLSATSRPPMGDPWNMPASPPLPQKGGEQTKNPYSGGVAGENWRRGFNGETLQAYKGSAAESYYQEGLAARAAVLPQEEEATAAVLDGELPAPPEMDGVADLAYFMDTPAEWDEDYRGIWQKLQVAERQKMQWRSYAMQLREIAAPASLGEAKAVAPIESLHLENDEAYPGDDERTIILHISPDSPEFRLDLKLYMDRKLKEQSVKWLQQQARAVEIAEYVVAAVNAYISSAPAAQPLPVALDKTLRYKAQSLPDRKPNYAPSSGDSKRNTAYWKGYTCGWNECLDDAAAMQQGERQ